MVSKVLFLLLLLPSLSYAGAVINSYIAFPPSGGSIPSINATYETAQSPGGSLTLTINVPSSSSSGKLLVALLCGDQGGATGWSDETGWTKRHNNITQGATAGVFTRLADGTEPSSYTFDYPDIDNLLGWIIVIDDADATTPYDTKGADGSTSGTSHSIPQVTTSEDDSLAIGLLCFDGGDGDPFSTSSTGWTELDELDSPSGSTAGHTAAGAVYHKDVETAGSAGALSVTSSVSDGASSIMISISP